MSTQGDLALTTFTVQENGLEQALHIQLKKMDVEKKKRFCILIKMRKSTKIFVCLLFWCFITPLFFVVFFKIFAVISVLLFSEKYFLNVFSIIIHCIFKYLVYI